MDIRSAMSRLIYPDVHTLAESRARHIERLNAELREGQELISELKTELHTLQSQYATDEPSIAISKNQDYWEEKLSICEVQKGEILAKLRGWRQSYWDEKAISKRLTEDIALLRTRVDELITKVSELQDENERLRSAGVVLRNHVRVLEQEMGE